MNRRGVSDWPWSTRLVVLGMCSALIALAVALGIVISRGNHRMRIINDLACQVRDLGGSPVDATRCPKERLPHPRVTKTMLRRGHKTVVITTPTATRPTAAAPRPTVTAHPRPRSTTIVRTAKPAPTRTVKVRTTKTASPRPQPSHTTCLPVLCSGRGVVPSLGPHSTKEAQ